MVTPMTVPRRGQEMQRHENIGVLEITFPSHTREPTTALVGVQPV